MIFENVDDYGSTPLHWASQQGYIKVTKCLLEFNADPNLQDVSIPNCRFAFIQIYGIDNVGDTPLHRACSWGSVEIAECLLDHNADPSIRSESFLLVSLCLLKCVL